MKSTAHHAIETRLNMWKSFFDSEQSEACGRGPLVAGHDTRLVPVGAPESEYGVDDLIKLAIESREPGLLELAELVDLMAINYLTCEANAFHAAMLKDEDGVPFVAKVRTGPPCFTADELDEALGARY